MEKTLAEKMGYVSSVDRAKSVEGNTVLTPYELIKEYSGEVLNRWNDFQDWPRFDKFNNWPNH